MMWCCVFSTVGTELERRVQGEKCRFGDMQPLVMCRVRKSTRSSCTGWTVSALVVKLAGRLFDRFKRANTERWRLNLDRRK